MIEQVSIECTRAEVTAAELVVRVALTSDAPNDARLSGLVHGPYSEQARTLPASFTLQAGKDGCLGATIIDPCYATPKLDMHYDIELELTSDGKRIAQHHTPLVLRRALSDVGVSNSEK